MRWLVIPCQVCQIGKASILIFDSVMICDHCRRTAIDWLRAHGFLLCHPHVFLDGLTDLEGRQVIHNLPEDSEFFPHRKLDKRK